MLMSFIAAIGYCPLPIDIVDADAELFYRSISIVDVCIIDVSIVSILSFHFYR